MQTLKGISIEQLRRDFKYDPLSPSKLSNSMGKPVGYISKQKRSNDYTYSVWKLTYRGKSWFAHRIVWVMHHSTMDESMKLNHIDNNPLNNSIENLEICTQAENNRRTSLHTGRRTRSDNQLQITGISLLSAKGYDYVVGRVRYNGKLYSKLFSISKLGIEKAIECAIIARQEMLNIFNIDDNAGFSDKVDSPSKTVTTDNT